MLTARARCVHVFVVAAGLAAVAGAAHAEGSETCNPAYEDADALMRTGGDKLLEARERLRVCAKPTCKEWMVKECTKSLTEVEARIPSVVFVAKDATGADLVDVTVTSSDRTLSSRLDGRSIEIGPGEKVFVFATHDGRRVSQKAVIKEGEKAQRVTVTFERSNGAVGGAHAPVVQPPASAPPRPVSAPPAAPAPATQRAAGPQDDGASLRAVGYVAGGLGIVGLGLGAIFGVTALGAKSDAHCDANDECDPAKLADARSSATLATVGFVAGGALLAGGAALVLFAPSRSSSSARLDAAPSVSQNTAGLLLRGRW
jgi:hypothetical protein